MEVIYLMAGLMMFDCTRSLSLLGILKTPTEEVSGTSVPRLTSMLVEPVMPHPFPWC